MIFLPPRLFLEGYSSAFNGFPECLPHGEGRFQDEFVIFVTCAYMEGGGVVQQEKYLYGERFDFVALFVDSFSMPRLLGGYSKHHQTTQQHLQL